MREVRPAARERLMSRRGPRARAALLAILALAALALGACGGDGDDDGAGGGGISEADVQDAGVKYARCMRERGFDVPDPQPGAGGLRSMLADVDPNEPGFREAERDCRRYLQGLVSQIDEEQRREFEESRLEFSRCMRERGFDVPDPQRGAGPEAGNPLGELDLNDPRVQEAIDACGEGLRDLGGGG
jgi:hypothetical protein